MKNHIADRNVCGSESIRNSKKRACAAKLFLATAVFVLLFAIFVAPVSAHTQDEHATWTEWNIENSMPGAAGSYYLTRDVILPATWDVPAGGVNFCLNGHTITLTESEGSVIEIGTGEVLNLYDCNTETTHYFDKNTDGRWILNDTNTDSPYSVLGGFITGGRDADFGTGVCNEGSFTMFGGNIVGNRANSDSGSVFVGENGEFVMNDGKIAGNFGGMGAGGVCVSNGGEFVMNGGSIEYNFASGNAGGVYVLGNFTLAGGKIANNTAHTSYGGGVFCWDGTFEMLDGVIEGNQADYGGGVCVFIDGEFVMNNGSIENNTATYVGGGVYVWDLADFTLAGGDIKNNVANDDGGGVYNTGTFAMIDGNVSNNKAYENGGGVCVRLGGEFLLLGGNVVDNNAGYYGGGVYNSGTFDMNDGNVSNNKADGYGGGVLDDGNFTLVGGNISNNTAAGNGGGVCVGINAVGSFTLVDGNITQNTATEGYGGGVYVNYYCEFEMLDGIIASNTANIGGGGVDSNGNFTMKGGVIASNTAEHNGVAIQDGGAFNVSGGAVISSNELYLCEPAIVRVTGDEFTGFIANITKDDLNVGDVIAEIDDASFVLAEDAVIGFILQDESKILVVSDDGKKLVAAQIPDPKISAAALSLSSDIAIRFHVLDEALVGYSEPYINVTFNETEYGFIRPVADAENLRQTFTFKNISPAEMDKTVTVKLYALKDGEDEHVLCDSVEYSAAKYCLNMINKHNAQNSLTTLCVDLLNYGSASQVYLGETDEKLLANNTLSEAQKSWASAFVAPTDDFEISAEGDDNVGIWRAASLNLYSDISLVFKFTTDADVSDLEAEIKYGTKSEKTAIVNNFVDSTYSGGACKLIKFNDLNALELNYPIEITLKNAGFESKTLTYSADAYAYSKMSEGGALGNLVDSIMKYITSVDNFA